MCKKISIENIKNLLEEDNQNLWTYGKKEIDAELFENEKKIRFIAGNTKLDIGVHYEIFTNEDEAINICLHLEFDENSSDKKEFYYLQQFLILHISKADRKKFIITNNNNKIEWKLKDKIKTKKYLQKNLNFMFETFEPILAQFTICPNNYSSVADLKIEITKELKKISKKATKKESINLYDVVSILIIFILVICLFFLLFTNVIKKSEATPISVCGIDNIEICNELEFSNKESNSLNKISNEKSKDKEVENEKK